jgi:hypothetical protein
MFRTPVIPAKSSEKIELSHTLYLIGSCFSEHIGQKLSENKFNSLTNPFGVVYNPVSIFKLLVNTISENQLDERYIIQNQGIYRHFDFHSDISALDKNELLSQIKEAYKYSKSYLLSSKWIILTLGTSIVYRHKRLNEIVSNCHKIPAGEFHKERLHPDEIVNAFQVFYDTLKNVNKSFNIILTVSPVRHLKDSLEINSISKSILRYVCEIISTSFPEVQYFPSFEIMMDDLRDYRFYETDMLHPNTSAIDYIWEAFLESYFDGETIEFVREWKKIRKALKHKAFYPDSKEHQQFIKNTLQQLQTFRGKVDISNEMKILEKQLK